MPDGAARCIADVPASQGAATSPTPRSAGEKGAIFIVWSTAPTEGTAAVVLGFPFGGRYKAREARLGPTSPLSKGAQGGPQSITPLFAGSVSAPGAPVDLSWTGTGAWWP